jgi:hypothetical protein
MKRVAGRIAGVLGLLVVCALLFDAPSAYAVAAHKPRWLAWAVGLLAFPIVPLVWNVLGERKRTVDPKKPATSTRWERITWRTLAVAVVVLGCLFGIRRGEAWRALRHHALWFIPSSPGALVADSPLLSRVPADATGLVWLRDTEGAKDAMSALGALSPLGSGDDFELVIAGDKKHVFANERGDVHFLDTFASLFAMNPWSAQLGFSPGGVKELPDGSRAWLSPGWTMGTAAPARLVDPMRRAPDDAFLIGTVLDVDGKGAAVGWIAGRDGELELVGEVTAASEAQAIAWMADIDKELGKHDKEIGCWRSSGAHSTLERDGRVIRGRASIAVGDIRGLFLCLDLKK